MAPPNDQKPPLELPSPRRTRASNRGKVVGAPDMSKPRRSHQEVLDQRTQEEQAKEKAAEKERMVRARIAELEASLLEELPPLGSPGPQPTKSAPNAGTPSSSNDVDTVDTLNVVQTAPAADSEPVDMDDVPIFDPPSDREIHVDASDNEAGDNYIPSEQESDSEMDIDIQGINAPPHADKARSTRRKGTEQVTSRSKSVEASASVGVGKRKKDDDAEPIRPVATKKSKPNQVSSAFVKDWEKITSNSSYHHDRLFTPPGPTRSDTPIHRGSRSSSQASALPSSSASEGDSLMSEHGYADNGDNCDPPSDNESESEIIRGDIRGALRYRSKSKVPTDYETRSTIAVDKDAPYPSTRAPSVSEPMSKSRKPAAGTATQVGPDALAKVKSRTSIVQGNQPFKTTVGSPTPERSTTPSVGGSATPQTREGRGSGKIRNTDIPAPILPLFTSRCVPLVRQYLGTQTPWEDIKLSELEKLCRKAFGDELADEFPLVEGDNLWKLIKYKVNDWHTGFATAARQTFKEIITDPDYKEHFSDTTAIGEYAQYLLGDAKRQAPFYWKKWNSGNDPIGRLQSAMITGTFAHHMSELQMLKGADRVRDFALGALTLAVLAATHTLTHYTTGEWKPPPKRLGHFSVDNYGDRQIFENGKVKTDKRMSRVLAVVKDLDDDEWSEIYTLAFKVAKERDSKARKKTAAAFVETAGAISDDDDDLMLPKHPKGLATATSSITVGLENMEE